LMILGRVVYGFGGESLGVAENTILGIWFQGSEVAFAMALNLTISRLGSIANDNLTPVFGQEHGLTFALWVGFVLICGCMICVLVMLVLYSYARSQGLAPKPANEGKEAGNSDSGFSFKSISNLHPMFWLLTASCLTVYCGIIPFHNVANSLLQDKYGYSAVQAGSLMAIPFIISCTSCSIIGALIDKFGGRALLITVSSGLILACHSLMAWTNVTPILSLVLLGVGYAIYASALWPSVTYIVDQNKLGMAYGIMVAIQNSGLALCPLMVGAIRDSTGSYTNVEAALAGLVAIGTVIGVFLSIMNGKNDGILNLPISVIRARQQQILQEQ